MISTVIFSSTVLWVDKRKVGFDKGIFYGLIKGKVLNCPHGKFPPWDVVESFLESNLLSCQFLAFGSSAKDPR